MILLLVLPATSLGKEIKWVLERPVIPVLVKKTGKSCIKGYSNQGQTINLTPFSK